jgi:hypothetical protein
MSEGVCMDATIQYGKVPAGARTKRWIRRAAMALGIAATIYVAAYAMSLRYRVPAMNLRYFCYDVQDVETDHLLYRVFYPAYKLHELLGLPGFRPHSNDRVDAGPGIPPEWYGR